MFFRTEQFEEVLSLTRKPAGYATGSSAGRLTEAVMMALQRDTQVDNHSVAKFLAKT